MKPEPKGTPGPSAPPPQCHYFEVVEVYGNDPDSPSCLIALPIAVVIEQTASAVRHER